MTNTQSEVYDDVYFNYNHHSGKDLMMWMVVHLDHSIQPFLESIKKNCPQYSKAFLAHTYRRVYALQKQYVEKIKLKFGNPDVHRHFIWNNDLHSIEEKFYFMGPSDHSTMFFKEFCATRDQLCTDLDLAMYAEETADFVNFEELVKSPGKGKNDSFSPVSEDEP